MVSFIILLSPNPKICLQFSNRVRFTGKANVMCVTIIIELTKHSAHLIIYWVKLLNTYNVTVKLHF